jgi:signal transduction histidine kinase
MQLTLQKANKVLRRIAGAFSIQRWKTRVQMEEKRALLSATAGLVFVLDQEGIFRSYLGGNAESELTPESFLGKKLRNLASAEFGGIVTACLRNVFLQEEMGVLFCEMTIASRPYSMEIRIAPSYPGNAVAVVHELTDKKQLEEELRIAQRTEIVGKLAVGLAHDFNNLLMVIDGYCRLLQTSIPEENPSHSQVRAIGRAAERAGSLTRQLLNFGQKTRLLPQILDLNEVIGSADKLLGILAGEQFEIRTHFAAGPAPVRMDRNEIERILMNLVINARDAMPQGGDIVIETSNVHLDEDYALQHENVLPGDYIMLAIRDAGEGIDEENLARIFEPFFTTKGHRRGVGMGLSSVSSIVEQNKGHISVESKLGNGTIFKIYLPQVELSDTALNEEEDNNRVRWAHPLYPVSATTESEDPAF